MATPSSSSASSPVAVASSSNPPAAPINSTIPWVDQGDKAVLKMVVPNSQPEVSVNITVHFPAGYTAQKKKDFLDKFDNKLLNYIAYTSNQLGVSRKSNVESVKFNLSENGLSKITKNYGSAKPEKEITQSYLDSKATLITDDEDPKTKKRIHKRDLFTAINTLWKNTYLSSQSSPPSSTTDTGYPTPPRRKKREPANSQPPSPSTTSPLAAPSGTPSVPPTSTNAASPHAAPSAAPVNSSGPTAEEMPST